MSDFEITPFCGGLFQTNGYLVKAAGAAYLFDAPEGVAEWLDEKGIGLDGLVLTHQHHDHVIDAGAVRQRFGCPLWAHSEPSEDLTMAKRLEQMTGAPCDLAPYTIDHLLEGEDSLSLDGLNLELFYVPGHSPDSVCFRIQDHPLVIGGDVLFRGSIGRTDFPHGDHDLLISGIREKLWPLPDDTQVLPGHGPATSVGVEKRTNPFL
ncbi:MAG: MBL fold metallo-hydrolase [Verrucomicrobiales bacterium]